MIKTFLRLARLAFGTTHFALAALGLWAVQLEAAPLRIVCIGDSITQGRGDHSAGGAAWTPTFSYRYPLWKLLVDAHADVDFVGSLHGGFESDPAWADYQGRKFARDHEGHWGWKTVDVAAKLPGWIEGYTPDVALILLGSNDANGKTPEEHQASVQRVRAAMTDIFSILRKKNPKVAILLGQCFQEWAPFPALRQAMTELAQAQATAASPIVLVDHATGWISDPKKTGTHTVDWVHPNAVGDEKLARNWLAALQPFLAAHPPAKAAVPATADVKTEANQAPRVYFIGNSVTDTVRYGSLVKLAAARGVKLNWGRTMIPGAPLEWLYTHPTDGFREEPYGTWTNALNHFPWDMVSLQPFDRHLHNPDKNGRDFGDVPLIKEFAGMAARQNPAVQIYLYARWPRVTSGGKDLPFDKNDYDPAKPGSGHDLAKVDDFTARWEAKYTGGWDASNETRDYFETLLREVRKETPFLKKKPLLVPVGHVMNALHTQMKAGQVPGYTSIYQFYKDGIHLNEAGSYLVGCTYFATLLQQSPVGLPTAPYGAIPPALAEIIQKTVWQVVTAHPDSGVTSR